jgi:uncharacterized repeat protein (TIGR03803 family)
VHVDHARIRGCTVRPAFEAIEHGDLYGTAGGAGASDAGTIFELTTSGKERVLHTFRGSLQGGTDGAATLAAGLLDVNGTLYGTTQFGGGSGNGGLGYGTIFELSL